MFDRRVLSLWNSLRRRETQPKFGLDGAGGEGEGGGEEGGREGRRGDRERGRMEGDE